MDRSQENGSFGWGSALYPDINLNIQTTTGGNFSITVNKKFTVEDVKKIVSKKLKVSKDRICLLHREQQLRNGTVEENGLLDGSRVILLPSVETGLLTHRPENSVMQALESLNDSQVNDFLSGKSPLNLTMRLGDHMMLIQLQLSTLNANGPKTTPAGPAAPNPALRRAYRNAEKQSATDKIFKKTVCVLPLVDKAAAGTSEPPSDEKASSSAQADDIRSAKKKSEEHLKSILNKQDIETLQNAFEIFKSLAEMQDDSEPNSELGSFSNQSDDSLQVSSAGTSSEEPTPIKSLSNFVSSPLKSTSFPSTPIPPVIEQRAPVKVPLPKFAPALRNEFDTPRSISTASSCLCSIINPNFMCDCHLQTGYAITKIENVTPFTSNLCNTLILSNLADGYSDTKNIAKQSTVVEQVNIVEDSDIVEHSDVVEQSTIIEESNLIEEPIVDVIGTKLELNKSIVATTSNEASEAIETFTSGIQEPIKSRKLHYLLHRTSSALFHPIVSKEKMAVQAGNSLKRPAEEEMGSTLKSKSPKRDIDEQSVSERVTEQPTTSQFHPGTNPVSDTKALIEASKNLTQTLKKLSKEVLTTKVNLSQEDATKAKIGQGAVIESMKHHGKGIYSGTFSGTLNPALQDRYGRPKRDISTIIHILNDLLCAAPAKLEPQPDAQNAIEASTSSGHPASCQCVICIPERCPYGQCDGHDPIPHSAACLERDSEDDYSPYPCYDKRNSKRSDNRTKPYSKYPTAAKQKGDKVKGICVKCYTARELENSKTKCKLDNLRMVMQQEKQRREARKKAAPYSAASVMPHSSIPMPSISPEQTQIVPEEVDLVA